MKEFEAQPGGRYTYADDIINLQQLALSFSQIFSECDDFIISGCEVSGSTITEGYVYLNGKIRRCQGRSGITEWPQFIYEQNTTVEVPYAESSYKLGRTEYECAIGSASEVVSSTQPSNPKSIKMEATGGALRIRDAFFGKYAVLKDGDPAAVQEIAGRLKVSGPVVAGNGIDAKGAIQLINGENAARCYVDNNNTLIIQSRRTNGQTLEMQLADDGSTSVVSNGSVICKLTSGKLVVTGNVEAARGVMGGITIGNNNHIYNHGDGALYLNYYGYDHGTTRYRDTVICNGKGTAMLSLSGQDNTVVSSVPLIIDGEHDLILKSSRAASDVTLTKCITWKDSGNTAMASLGFTSAAYQNFALQNQVGQIYITGKAFVNIGPVIYENGESLSSKYVMQTTFTTQMQTKANTADVYTKEEAGKRFANIVGGLKQFVGPSSQTSLRGDIGALGKSDVENVYARIDQLFADICKTDAQRLQARKNIGAVSADEVEPKHHDTGWTRITDGYSAKDLGLYVRQIGNIVSIQGYIYTRHQSTQFTLPTNIQPPTYAVSYCSSNTKWGGKIAENSRDFIVTQCDKHDVTIPFSLTYMV